jgi:hypothetical protein
MAIPSSNHPSYPLFHCINKGWKEGSTVVFHFLPSNESEARMYISGLIAYLRATALPWYLDLFKPLARTRSLGTTWDPATKQLTSILDSNFTDTLQQDPLYDLTDSTAALISNYPSSTSTSIVFDIPVQDGTSIGFYKDTDSISTFRSNVRSVLKKKNSTGTTTTATSTPTQSVSFAPFKYSQKADDASLSRMSDTASKVASLETRFDKMETQITNAFARLEAIFSGTGTHSLLSVPDGTGSSNKPQGTAAGPGS